MTIKFSSYQSNQSSRESSSAPPPPMRTRTTKASSHYSAHSSMARTKRTTPAHTTFHPLLPASRTRSHSIPSAKAPSVLIKCIEGEKIVRINSTKTPLLRIGNSSAVRSLCGVIEHQAPIRNNNNKNASQECKPSRAEPVGAHFDDPSAVWDPRAGGVHKDFPVQAERAKRRIVKHLSR